MSKIIRVVFGMLLALVGSFFIFYTIRLLYVTRALTAIRAGGQGAYIGAIAFPIIGLLCIWGAVRCLKGKRRR